MPIYPQRIAIALALGLLMSASTSLAGADSADDAAAQARAQTGGRVLAVTPTDGGYQVKVLTPDGQVRLVFIAGN